MNKNNNNTESLNTNNLFVKWKPVECGVYYIVKGPCNTGYLHNRVTDDYLLYTNKAHYIYIYIYTSVFKYGIYIQLSYITN